MLASPNVCSVTVDVTARPFRVTWFPFCTLPFPAKHLTLGKQITERHQYSGPLFDKNAASDALDVPQMICAPVTTQLTATRQACECNEYQIEVAVWGPNRVAESQTVRPARQTVRPGRQTVRQSTIAQHAQTVRQSDIQTIRPSDNQFSGSRQSYKNPEIQHHFCRSLREPSQGPTKILLPRCCLTIYLSRLTLCLSRLTVFCLPFASDCLTVCLPGLTV